VRGFLRDQISAVLLAISEIYGIITISVIFFTQENPYGWWTLDDNSFDASYYGKIDMATGIKSNGMRKQ